MIMTREQWLARFIGAYQAVSGCSDEEAEEAARDFEGQDINLENDCPVATAEEAWKEDAADDLPETGRDGTGAGAG